jgi:uncharacterized protein YbjQ (UPF0145 family)
MEDISEWLRNNRLLILAAVAVLVGLLLLKGVLGGLRRFWRRRRPVMLHPKLQAFAGRSEAEVKADRIAAGKIVATSSTGVVTGYDIIRQIDAVFVEGHRTQEEAIAALKAAAGRRGANAVVNISQQRTTAGRCTAQGDAVLMRPQGRKTGPTGAATE